MTPSARAASFVDLFGQRAAEMVTACRRPCSYGDVPLTAIGVGGATVGSVIVVPTRRVQATMDLCGFKLRSDVAEQLLEPLPRGEFWFLVAISTADDRDVEVVLLQGREAPSEPEVTA